MPDHQPMDWAAFEPNMLATLMFVIQDGQILLIRKKRGLGAGKMNGPGGKIEPGETPLQAVIRETQEEVGLTPDGARELGVLRFQFTSGLAILCYVFRADTYTGQLIETDEATPYWVPIADIPYPEMWADDIYWLPHILTETKFQAYFEFDDEVMLSRRVDLV
jgi:8-oxo-dGTP diphosphatase